MAQLAYHVSMGLPLWGYPVHKGTVLYLALEDDHRRLQGRLYRMFGTEAPTICSLRSTPNSLALAGGTAKEVRPGTPEHQADYH